MAETHEVKEKVVIDCALAYDQPYRNVIYSGGTIKEADTAGKAAVAKCNKEQPKELVE
jgi:hypothetical protein